jgi:ferrochelatase
MTRTGIVLAQMGGPGNLDEVAPFIRSIFSDRDVVPIGGPPWVSTGFGMVVSKIRGPRAREYYRQIGGGSPILATTCRQAELLAAELQLRGHDAAVAVAMRHSRPDTMMAVQELCAAGVEQLVLLPLYPHYSFATTGSSEKELRQVLAELAPSIPLTVIRTWHDHPSYLDLQTRLVTEMLDKLPSCERENAAVLFSAHGLPQSAVSRGDPYPGEIERTVAGVIERLDHRVDARLGYQSRSGPISWIGPGTEEFIDEFAREGRESISLVPISFVSDHVETLYEVDILFRDVARDAGIEHYQRAAVLNDGAGVGPMLADIFEDHP